MIVHLRPLLFRYGNSYLSGEVVNKYDWRRPMTFLKLIILSWLHESSFEMLITSCTKELYLNHKNQSTSCYVQALCSGIEIIFVAYNFVCVMSSIKRGCKPGSDRLRNFDCKWSIIFLLLILLLICVECGADKRSCWVPQRNLLHIWHGWCMLDFTLSKYYDLKI